MPRGEHHETEEPRGSTRRRAVITGALLLLVLLGLNGVYRAARAVQTATRGKAALLRAENQLTGRQPKLARQDLIEARTAFSEARRQMTFMGPLLPLAHITPFVRIQVRGVLAFADAGVALSDAGIGLTDSAAAIVEPTDERLPVSGAVDSLRVVHQSLQRAVKGLDSAIDRVSSLNGYRLVGPIDDARDDLATRLPRIDARATSAERGLSALLAFAGGSGPRRYLFFSQNPDEPRPTGGFMGTYGLLVAHPDALSLERFESIDGWLAAHPAAVIPPENAPSPLRYAYPPKAQSIANANAVADWPRAARLAAELWQKGGEQPVDGVVSVSPAFLARVLGVVGPVEVPSYQEVVTASNVIERFDFHTRQVETYSENVVRKAFVAELAQTVMHRVLAAPASQWEPLAGAIGAAFDGREAMAWSTDEHVAAVTAERGWDGALPATTGDFFYGAEFHFDTKSGRGLRRTYDHHVDLRPDGSARASTVLTIKNPEPRRPSNDKSVIFVTAYGPHGAALDPSSDPALTLEPPIAGHPAAGWFTSAGPLSEAKLKVVWEVPKLAHQRKDGTWELALRWMRLPDHSGDVLNMKVDLPPGWAWLGEGPPPSVNLERDVVASWSLGPQG